MRSIPKLSFWRMAGVATAAALFVAACGGTTTAPKTVSGGVVTFAEGANAAPNYILPLASGSYFSVTNLSDFSQNMYLPLYWFGTVSGEPILNKGLSVANPPVFSNGNKTVTITMKHWQWSNGTPITSRDVIFWMNLLAAATAPNAPAVGTSSAPGPGWGAEVAGGFPFNVVSYKATGTYTVQMNLNAAYNPTWFTYNELSQIYPLPQASWDELSTSGPIGNYDAQAEARSAISGTSPTQYQPTNPGTGTSGALGVAQFLNLQSQALSTYASNPLWQVVDGPFKLSQFTTSGFVKMVPNKNYSGSPKPTISAFEEEPFTSDTAEFNEIHSGSLTIGYIPAQDIAQKAGLEKSEGYSFAPWYDFGFVYFPYNFTNPTVGPIFKQLYFRQAFQSLVNQPEYSKDFLAGYGSIDNGPVPTYPKNNPDESPLEAKGQIYPYSPSKAVSLLKDNGWTVNPGGTSVCSKPGTAAGDCGAGIKSGQAASFDLLYASGTTALTNQMETLQSAAKQYAGIDLTLSTAPFSQVISTAFGSACTDAKPCSNWELANWGGGWVYSPDYLPTGGELFQTGASSNPGYYNSSEANSLIAATHNASTAAAETTALFNYEDYIAKQLPVVYMPNQPYQLTMYKSNLSHYGQGVYDEIYPQYYSFSS
ncbi:MAG: ABC transporter substrate-binding protein [Candidatus Dormibacteraeota bacterium]|nr:ABC transporter substrate-binding protein [Candidatus Dormibacteraeota bacterium]